MENNWQTNSLEDWIISNLAWEVVLFIFTIIFLNFFPDVFQSIKISRKILKDNRDTRGNPWGKYSADRFIDIWYSNPKTPLRYERGRFYYRTFNNPNSRYWMDVIDKQLVDLELIEIFDYNNCKAVKPIKNWRNSLIAYFVKFYLIHFIGDNFQYYRDIEEQSKKIL